MKTSKIKQALQVFNPEGDFTLWVGWQSTAKSYHLRRVDVTREIAGAFREIASEQIDTLLERDEEAWTPMAEVTEKTFLHCQNNEVGQSPRLTNRPKDDRFLAALLSAETFEKLNAAEVRKKNLAIYGFTIGSPGQRVAFIRRANPRRGLGQGKFFGALNDTLAKIDDPVFAFDDLIDLVVTQDDLAVLSQSAFTMLFRDNDALNELVPSWGKRVQEQYPFADGVIDVIIERAKRDSRIRTRLESVATRGHLKGISAESMKRAMIDCDLDPERHINAEGELVTRDDENLGEFMWFLNEDLYAGSLSSTGFRVDRKATR